MPEIHLPASWSLMVDSSDEEKEGDSGEVRIEENSRVLDEQESRGDFSSTVNEFSAVGLNHSCP